MDHIIIFCDFQYSWRDFVIFQIGIRKPVDVYAFKKVLCRQFVPAVCTGVQACDIAFVAARNKFLGKIKNIAFNSASAWIKVAADV